MLLPNSTPNPWKVWGWRSIVDGNFLSRIRSIIDHTTIVWGFFFVKNCKTKVLKCGNKLFLDLLGKNSTFWAHIKSLGVFGIFWLELAVKLDDHGSVEKAPECFFWLLWTSRGLRNVVETSNKCHIASNGPGSSYRWDRNWCHTLDPGFAQNLENQRNYWFFDQ